MKMSSAVKGYILEKVDEKYPLMEVPKPFDTTVINKEIEEATTPIIKKILAKYADRVSFHVYLGNGEYRPIPLDEANIVGSYTYGGSKRDVLRDKAMEHNKAIEKKRAKVFRDIIVQMELGGTKKDLDELLANLPD